MATLLRDQFNGGSVPGGASGRRQCWNGIAATAGQYLAMRSYYAARWSLDGAAAPYALYLSLPANLTNPGQADEMIEIITASTSGGTWLTTAPAAGVGVHCKVNLGRYARQVRCGFTPAGNPVFNVVRGVVLVGVDKNTPAPTSQQYSADGTAINRGLGYLDFSWADTYCDVEITVLMRRMVSGNPEIEYWLRHPTLGKHPVCFASILQTDWTGAWATGVAGMFSMGYSTQKLDPYVLEEARMYDFHFFSDFEDDPLSKSDACWANVSPPSRLLTFTASLKQGVITACIGKAGDNLLVGVLDSNNEASKDQVSRLFLRDDTGTTVGFSEVQPTPGQAFLYPSGATRQPDGITVSGPATSTIKITQGSDINTVLIKEGVTEKLNVAYSQLNTAHTVTALMNAIKGIAGGLYDCTLGASIPVDGKAAYLAETDTTDISTPATIKYTHVPAILSIGTSGSTAIAVYEWWESFSKVSLYCRVSTDAGLTWGDEIEIANVAGEQFADAMSCIWSPRYGWLISCTHEVGTTNEMMVIRCTDPIPTASSNWTQQASGITGVVNEATQIDESCICEFRGRLYMVIRKTTSPNFAHLAVSDNGGVTWADPFVPANSDHYAICTGVGSYPRIWSGSAPIAMREYRGRLLFITPDNGRYLNRRWLRVIEATDPTDASTYRRSSLDPLFQGNAQGITYPQAVVTRDNLRVVAATRQNALVLFDRSAVRTVLATDLRKDAIFGEVTGTLAVPDADQVAVGVPVDDTVGTAVLTAEDVREAVDASGMGSAFNLMVPVGGGPGWTPHFTPEALSSIPSATAIAAATWGALRSGLHAVGSFGEVMATLLSRITGGTVTVRNPLAGDGSLTLYQKNDHTVATGRQIEFTDDGTWPDLTNADLWLSVERTETGEIELGVEGTLVDTDPQRIRFEPTRTDAAGLTPGVRTHVYEAEATLDDTGDDVATLVTDVASVIAKVRT